MLLSSIKAQNLIYLQNLKMVANCGEKNYLLKKLYLNMYVPGLRFQLIEGRAISKVDIKITFED
jgi:hypothetical protein